MRLSQNTRIRIQYTGINMNNNVVYQLSNNTLMQVSKQCPFVTTLKAISMLCTSVVQLYIAEQKFKIGRIESSESRLEYSSQL